MELNLFNYRVHGKWILAGEHSVLRGGKALVFPVSSRYLDFSYEKGTSLSLEIEHCSSDLEMAFWGVLEKALQKLNLSRQDVLGKIKMESNIPVGAGMGASATLCVSLARWFSDLGYLKNEEQYEFAKSLENLFHGESSGVDVAVALNHKSLIFSKPQTMEVFEPKWQPHFYLSYCGQRGVTADCIRRVQKLLKQDPESGEEIDLQMFRAVETAVDSLLKPNDLQGLTNAIELANDCFNEWGLISQSLETHMSELKEAGAVATKPTGSGDGGFVLSLWETPPTDTSKFDFLIKA